MARWLREQSHDVFSAFEEFRGASDQAILERAHAENRILITNDHDFGERIVRDREPHSGVILLRLRDDRTAAKISALRDLLHAHLSILPGRFVVVSEGQVRVTEH